MRGLAAVALWLALLPGGSAEELRPDVALFPSGAEFRLELAISDEERALGYMFRERIPEDEGMLFFFERPGLHGIWMRNCKAPLDIIWLDGRSRVVHIEHDAPPCADGAPCPSMKPMRASSYVLEIAAGGARRHDLQLGDRVLLVEMATGRSVAATR